MSVLNDYLLNYVKSGEVEKVKMLLENGANAKDVAGFAALKYACEKGDIKIVKLLLEKGGDPNGEDYDAVKWASLNGHVEVLILLLIYGGDMYYARLCNKITGKKLDKMINSAAKKIQIKFRDWYYKPICKDGSIGLHCKRTLKMLN